MNLISHILHVGGHFKVNQTSTWLALANDKGEQRKLNIFTLLTIN